MTKAPERLNERVQLRHTHGAANIVAKRWNSFATSRGELSELPGSIDARELFLQLCGPEGFPNSIGQLIVTLHVSFSMPLFLPAGNLCIRMQQTACRKQSDVSLDPPDPGKMRRNGFQLQPLPRSACLFRLRCRRNSFPLSGRATRSSRFAALESPLSAKEVLFFGERTTHPDCHQHTTDIPVFQHGDQR